LQLIRNHVRTNSGDAGVLVIRATAKLLTRLGPASPDPPVSTTVLGDWYAKPFPIAQRRFVVFTSERSRIAVLMPGRDVAALPRTFPAAMAQVLLGLEIPEDLVANEMASCGEVVVSDTAGNKSMLGTLNDHAAQAQHRLRWIREPDLVTESVSLCHTPMAPLGYGFAADVARELFGLEPFGRGRRSSF